VRRADTTQSPRDTGWARARRRGALTLLLAALLSAWIALPPGAARALSGAAAPPREEPSPDLLAPIRDALERAEAAAEAEAPVAEESRSASLSRARLLAASGDPTGAFELLKALDPLRGNDTEAIALFTDIALRLHEYDEARDGLEALSRIAPASEARRRLEMQWRLAADDLEGLERFCRGVLDADPSSPAALLGMGELERRLMRLDAADRWFREALSAAKDDWEKVRALEGVAAVHYDAQRFDSSLVYLERAVPIAGCDDRVLESLNLTLIRLGRVAEAIDAAELAVRINPYNEGAQYQLGNGYTRRNYTELEAAYPDAFPDEAEAHALAKIESSMAAGRKKRALAMLSRMAREHGDLTDVHTRMGSILFEMERFDEALRCFQRALEACPGNGRARNGIAKALEAKRMRIDVHREAYEKAFAEAQWPEVPRIEDFVINYNSLSERHRKRVAMSIAPLGAFVPVLVESGASFYIKPLYQRLSSCPGLETLEDARIDYDSRLWDDVRGCGGYSTVTGIEDVERMVLGGYNTVLHELTHQVHGVLTSEEKREVQELYRRAKERHAAGQEAFVSRYQASSVWEYLAEGVNSYMTPRRDRYDTKQVVRERLMGRDPDLVAFVRKLISKRDMTPHYAVGYANAGDDRVSRNRVQEALSFYRMALEKDPSCPEAQRGLVMALCISGEREAACEEAERALAENPQEARLAIEAARAHYLRDGDNRARIERLSLARQSVEPREVYLIDLELGDAFFTQGAYDSAVAAYGQVLEYQNDNPEALWGQAMALSASGDHEGARERFEKALFRRSGLVELRTDFAAALIEAGDLESAAAQVREAELLDPDCTEVLSARGRLELERKRPGSAVELLVRAVEKDPEDDFSRILLARARLESGDSRGAWTELEPVLGRIESGAPPDYEYNARKAAFELVHTFPAHQRAALYEIAAAAARSLGLGEEAERYERLSRPR